MQGTIEKYKTDAELLSDSEYLVYRHTRVGTSLLKQMQLLELGKEKEELQKATKDIAEYKEKRDMQFARKNALEKQIVELKQELERKRQGERSDHVGNR